MAEHPDRVAALVQYMQNNQALDWMVENRVFDEELPDNIVSRMPIPSIIVMSNGGSRNIGSATNDFSDEVVAVRCYAWKTLESARAVEFQVYDLLRTLSRVVVGDVLLHWCRAAGGAIPIRSQAITWPGGVVDESTHWPYVQRSWQVLAADIPVPVS